MSEIIDWLGRIGLGQYAEAFQSNGVDFALLKALTNDDLKDIGVGRLADRKRLLEEIERLSSTVADWSGNRRLLTVLFCDVIGSTELSTQLDPEDLRAALRRYQETAHASISKFGGVIANDLGDGVMAYFGWPSADEDQARQAVRAGFDMIEAIGKNDGRGQETALRCRVGVATGRVVVGGDKQLDSAFGETPNLAARLQSLANENCVVIDRTTRHMIGPAFRTTSLGSLTLKGFQSPVDVWHVTEERKYLDRFDSFHEGVSKFVGRKDELRWLMLGWRNLDQGQGRTAIVRGEPGMGKSRLVRELEQTLREESPAVLRFQCSPNHVNSAFHPVIQSIELSAGFEPHGEPPAVKLEKLSRLFADAIAGESRLPFLLSDLLAIPHDGADQVAALSPAERRQLLIKALTDNAVQLSRAAPVLVILEDAHWIDPSSLEMLQRLAERADDERIFVLVTTRPGRELQLPGTVTELGLGRLKDADVAALARSIVGDTSLSEQELASIVRRVEGVPLFAEELTSTLVERRSDVFRDLPENIQASITARLDALGPARHAAQVASVIGRDFSYAQLARLAGGAVADLEKSLDHLIRSGLVLLRDSRDRTCMFKHALVRDVAYESLLHEPRRQLHLRFAREVLVDEDRERIPELAAHHLTEGGAILEALEYWKRAGYRAARASAAAEAIAHFLKGLSLIGSLKESDERDRLELAFLVGINGPLVAVEGHTGEKTQAHLARALELARKLTDAPEIYPALFGRWNNLVASGLIRESLDTAQEYSNLAERQGNRDALYARHRMLATSHMCLGALDEAQSDAENAISLYVPEEHEKLVTVYGSDFRVAAHGLLAEILWLKGDCARARQIADQGVQCAKGIRHSHSAMMAHFFAGLVSLMRQDRASVRIYLNEVMALASRQAIGSWPPLATIILGWAKIADGQLEPGLAQMNDGLDTAKRMGISMFVPILRCQLADILLAQGRVSEALKAIAETDAITERFGDHYYYGAEVWRLKAECDMRSGQTAAAETKLRTALDLARQQHAKSLELRVVISYARFLVGRGQLDQARALLSQAIGEFGLEPENPDLAVAQALLETLPARSA